VVAVRTARLGHAGPEISVVGFGAWEAGMGREWGVAPPEDQVVQAIRTVLDTGIGWIDTAEVYGKGRSEELVSRAIAGHRDEVRLFTKVRPEQVGKACRNSLERLRTDHLDLYQLHWPDDTGVEVEDTWGAMATLVDEGLVRFVGVSNFDRELIQRCEKVRHVDSLQQELSMLHLDDRELIRWCGETGIGVLSYGPLAYGLLTGAIGPETTFPPGDFRGSAGWDAYDEMFKPGKIDRSLAVPDAVRPVAGRLGLTVSQLALAWNFHQPGVTAAIAGSRNPEHVRSNAGAGEVELDDATLAELEALLPLGPAFA
jgi:aryl-alcohol dehydrogenase-like predicted oxidoreductase